MLAISDKRRHWFDSRKINRFGSPPARADSETRTHRSRDPDRSVPHSDRFRHGEGASPPAKSDSCAARFHSERDPPKMLDAPSSSPRGLRYRTENPARKATRPPQDA